MNIGFVLAPVTMRVERTENNLDRPRKRNPVRVERFPPTDHHPRESVLVVVDGSPDSVDYRTLVRSSHSITLVAVDGVRPTDGVLYRLGLALLEAGSVYFVATGPSAARLERILDDAILFGAGESGGVVRLETEESVIMTVAEADLDEALWFAMACAYPAVDYEATCNTLLVVCDDPAVGARLSAALADADAFLARFDD